MPVIAEYPDKGVSAGTWFIFFHVNSSLIRKNNAQKY
jgi:hypothetical protein